MTAGFCASEIGRLSGCLCRLMPHLRLGEVAVTGGVAIQLGMAELGLEGSRKTIDDLDLVALSLDAVTPGIAASFLVSHYHVVQPGVPKFMVQLVDPVSGIRVDIFPDLAGSLTRARAVTIGMHSVRMLALQDIHEHKLQTISKASRADPVDPKHARDALMLGTLFGRMIPEVAEGSLIEDVYGTDVNASCRPCELSSSADFPLASKNQIFNLLGWMPTRSSCR